MRRKLSAAKRKAVILRDGFQCYLCDRQVVDIAGPGGRANRLTIDHVIPVSAGGSNDLDNLRVCCKGCNTDKGNALDYQITERNARRLARLERKQARSDARRLFGLAMFLADMALCQPIRKGRYER